MSAAMSMVLLAQSAHAQPRPVFDASPHISASEAESIHIQLPETSVTPAASHIVLKPPPEQPSNRAFSSAEVSHELERLRGQASVSKPSRVSAQAAWQLGLVYLHGAGVAVDMAQAQSWFELADHHANWAPQAPAGLAWCQMMGCQGPPDYDRAALSLSRLRGGTMNGRATYLRWALAQLNTEVPVVRPGTAAQGGAPLPHIDELLNTAARQGDAQARVELGIRASMAHKLDEAERWFKSAAPASRAARVNLERLQLRQRQASALTSGTGAGAATFAEAQRLHQGAGGPANYARAIELYRQAAQQGSALARAMLELIFSRPAEGGHLNVVWMQQLANVDVRGALPQLNPNIRQQFVRDPTPLFDLMTPFWQQQLPMTEV